MARWTLPWIWSGPIRSSTPSRPKVAATDGLTRASLRVSADSSTRRAISAILAEPCESTKFMPSQSSTIPSSPLDERMTLRTRSSRASAVAKEVAVEPDNSNASGLLVLGVVGDVPVDLRTWLTPEQSDIGACGHGDQPQQREGDADHDASEHTKDQSCEDGDQCDPEVEALNPRHPPHLRDVHHAHDDGFDDHSGENWLRQVGEQRRKQQQRQQNGQTRCH